MAYICTKNIPCNQCEHCRPDPDKNGEPACWAQLDEAAARRASLRELIQQRYPNG